MSEKNTRRARGLEKCWRILQGEGETVSKPKRPKQPAGRKSRSEKETVCGMK